MSLIGRERIAGGIAQNMKFVGKSSDPALFPMLAKWREEVPTAHLFGHRISPASISFARCLPSHKKGVSLNSAVEK
jgi:hypothetical protein